MIIRPTLPETPNYTTPRGTIRAFILLQRMIVVDAGVQANWEAAFRNGETACEKLGSVHLLSQGIFAFKVNSVGAITDLVFAEPPNDSLLARAVEGFVLTEWKVARTPAQGPQKFAEARAQADLYKRGALAGTELTRYRYLIVVSENELLSTSVPADITTADGVIYRHINIVVDPSSPSVAARRPTSAPI